MKICILSAKTGNGHYAVANAISQRLQQTENVELDLANDFYESLSPYTAMLSDFYNLLQVRSKGLCKIFTELACMENDKKQEEIYNLIEPSIKEYMKMNFPDIILSVTPLVNRYIIRFIKENHLKIQFYEIITDPFLPMYPGFDVFGADGYFCPTPTIYNYFKNKGFSEDQIFMTGYPLNKNFYSRRLGRDRKTGNEKFTILINSGSNGNISYFNIIASLSQVDKIKNAKIIFLCGNNVLLYELAMKKYKENPNIEIRLYEKKLYSLLSDVNICVAKPGANTLFECIAMKVPILIDALEGLLFQESGVAEFIAEWPVGEVAHTKNEMQKKIEKMIEHYEKYLDAINDFPVADGVSKILSKVLQREKGGYYVY